MTPKLDISPDLLPWRWENFSPAEMRCRCCGKVAIKPSTMDKLQAFRKAYGRPMTITSAYRCHSANRGRGYSHGAGLAVDVRVHGKDAYHLVGMAMAEGVMGVGVNQIGLHQQRFVHLDWWKDSVKRPRVWSYK